MINKELINIYKSNVKKSRFPYVCFKDNQYIVTDGHVLLMQKTTDKPQFEMFNPLTGEQEEYYRPDFERVADYSFFEKVKPEEFVIYKRKEPDKNHAKEIIQIKINEKFVTYDLNLFKKITFAGLDGQFYFRTETDPLHYVTDKGQASIMPIKTTGSFLQDDYNRIKKVEFSELHKAIKTVFVVYSGKKIKIYANKKDAEDFIKLCPYSTYKEVILN